MAPSPEFRRTSRWPQGPEAVARLAGWFQRNGGRRVEYDELISVGHEALVLAEREFTSERGVPFEAYARTRVRRAMADAIRREEVLGARMQTLVQAADLADGVLGELAMDSEYISDRQTWVNSSAAAATLAVVHGMDVDGDPAERLERARIKAHAKAFCARRPPPVARLFRLIYDEGMSLDDAAKACDISVAWASRLHAREIATLAKELRPTERRRASARPS